ncbi:MAG: phosphatase PAP2 family protein [Acidimicrobiales bacterium]
MTSAPSPGNTFHLRWWKEVLYALAFYVIYSFIRNQFGSAAVSEADAFANAKWVISVERALGLFHEETIQQWFLNTRWFIQAWNIFYGSFHFVVTAFALIFLFRRGTHRYVRWRTTLAATTGLALIGFAFFPLLPPRLLPNTYGFIDTLADFGGLWSFDSESMKAVSNQYAAMPSLHFGWSTWSALVLLPAMRHVWSRVLVIAYPIATLFAIVVTANHFWLDAAGGALVLGLGYLIGRQWDLHRQTKTKCPQ